MAVYGGDLAQLEDLAARFRQEGAEIEALESRIGAALQSTAWTGPAADRFRQAWSGDFVPALRRLREAMAENGTAIARRRQAIESATS
jgi:WXG100 family type VII secretion target